jgi:hypothetical protein
VIAGSRHADTTARERRALTILALLTALFVASLFCAAVVEVRNHYAHDSFFRFLDWNLFLAWIPVALAFLVYESASAGRPLAAFALGVVWLLFFPNAPYMLTDFIHLRESPSTPLWYDGLMLSAFAWTALVLGFLSLYLMQLVWRRAVGPTVAWAGVVAARARASGGGDNGGERRGLHRPLRPLQQLGRAATSAAGRARAQRARREPPPSTARRSAARAHVLPDGGVRGLLCVRRPAARARAQPVPRTALATQPRQSATARSGRAGRSLRGSTKGIAAVVPSMWPCSESTSMCVPGAARSIGTRT